MSEDEIDAVIFDCDGVLVNSEELAQAVEMEYLGNAGLSYQSTMFMRRFSGITMAQFRDLIRADFLDQLGIQVPELFFDGMKCAVVASYEESLAPLEGVIEFVHSLASPIAIASGSSSELLQMKLEKVGLTRAFGANVFSSEFSRSKPHPDVFLEAAASLGISPERAVVIEDSIIGVIGAKRAGMFAIGYTGGGHCPVGHYKALYEAGADLVFNSFRELAGHLRFLSKP